MSCRIPGLTSTPNYDTSLFSSGSDYAQKLNNDLERISRWACQWKMSFNPDPKEQAVGVKFSRKAILNDTHQLTFNNTTVSQVNVHKHLGLNLDTSLKLPSQ